MYIHTIMNMNMDQHNQHTQVVVSQKTFVENVKKWVIYDQQLKLIKEKSDQIRDMKHTVGLSICNYMIENPVSHNEIEITNGKIKVFEKKEYSPLTFSYIEHSLAKIIPEKSHVDYIITYLKDNREIKTSVDLKSIYKK